MGLSGGACGCGGGRVAGVEIFRPIITEWMDKSGKVSTTAPLTFDFLLCDGNLPFQVSPPAPSADVGQACSAQSHVLYAGCACEHCHR